MITQPELFQRAKKASSLLAITLNIASPGMKDIRQALDQVRACNAALQSLERLMSGVLPPKDGE